MLVLAGAGSGKTRVITHRVARLVDRGVRPAAILAVSFTNKAAAELRGRMVPLVGKERSGRLWLSTFHRFGVRFLQEEARAIGYPSRFVIFDQGDAIGAVREIVRREGLGDRSMDLAAVHARISLWKNKGLAPSEVPASAVEYDEVARDVYPYYEAALRSMHAVDFDDLVLLPVNVLASREDLRDKWRRRFRHLLVDEFQDTNRVQLELVKLLTNELRNVCVVGDDDQSIYGWRGAEVGNILAFERHFAGAEVVKLEDNYRSRAPILAVANAAIAQARRPRHPKVLNAVRGAGPKVRIVTQPDASAEARFVAQEIRSLAGAGVRPGQVAVLYRSNLQARPVEEELRVEGYPYRMLGGTELFSRKEVKDAVAYLRVVVNPSDELSLRRILNSPPRGIGDATVARLTRWALVEGVPFAEALARIETIPDVPDAARRSGSRLFAAFGRARSRFRGGADLAGAARALLDDVGLRDALVTDKNPRRWANVEHVLGALRRYEERERAERPSVGQFLTRLMLRLDGEEEADGGDRVTLSSLHAAKGLEFDVVFLIGLNEGQLPHARTTDPKVTEAAPTDVEEERRLFYVGVTRARERLYLCRPAQRTLRGRTKPLVPSRFLEGLPDEHLEEYGGPRTDEPLGAEEAVDLGRALLADLKG
ncbi:MAG: ATP-dependent helicase [Sandaracinaceae bacterium]